MLLQGFYPRMSSQVLYRECYVSSRYFDFFSFSWYTYCFSKQLASYQQKQKKRKRSATLPKMRFYTKHYLRWTYQAEHQLHHAILLFLGDYYNFTWITNHHPRSTFALSEAPCMMPSNISILLKMTHTKMSFGYCKVRRKDRDSTPYTRGILCALKNNFSCDKCIWHEH
jgi:hypothetical protein